MQSDLNLKVAFSTSTRGILTGKISPRVYEACSSCPGRKQWREREFFFETTAANLEHLALHLPEIEWSEEAKAKLESIRKLRQLEAERVIVVEEDGWSFKTNPYDHQKEAFYLSRDRESFAYFMEMGTGKTHVGINVMAWLHKHKEVDTILILAPNGVHRQWIKEQIPDHFPEEIQHKRDWYESSKSKSVVKRLQEVMDYKGLRIIAQHIESLSYSSGFDFAESFLKSGKKSLIILDESSRIKSPSSIRTKNVLKLRDLASYRRIMSGTPIANGVEDLYSQFMFLDKNILGYSSFFTFKSRYCVMGGFEQRQIVGYRNLPELQRRIDGHAYRKTKEECLTLPEKIFVTREVEFTPEQKVLYEQVKEDFLAELSDGTVVEMPLAIVRMLRLQQILSGHFPNPETKEIQYVPSNRTTALLEVLEEAGESKVIVWTRFKHDIDMISKALQDAKIGFVTYTGETSQNDRIKAIDDFRNDPSIKVFLGNPSAAGIGLNLTVANVVVWYSMTFNLDEYLQANDRCHRIGQKWPVTYVTLVTPGSLDVKISKALKSKKNIADTVLDVRELLE